MPNTPSRILAIDPTNKGFGFAVLELPFRLVECGLAHITGDKLLGTIARFESFLARFRPDTVVVEDTEAPGSRRQPRLRRLVAMLMKSASDKGVAVVQVARTAVLKRFDPTDAKATKQSIAERLAKDFPELKSRLPAPRRAWQSEDLRMSIFDALALAVTHATR